MLDDRKGNLCKNKQYEKNNLISNINQYWLMKWSLISVDQQYNTDIFCIYDISERGEKTQNKQTLGSKIQFITPGKKASHILWTEPWTGQILLKKICSSGK